MTQVETAPQPQPQEAKAERVVVFEIDGDPYDCPRLDELDLDEEQILWDLAGVALPDFMPAHPESPPEVKTAVDLIAANRTRHPGFKRALVHIAYRRRNLELSFRQIGERVGKVNGLDAELALLGKAQEAAEPEGSDKPDPPHGT